MRERERESKRLPILFRSNTRCLLGPAFITKFSTSTQRLPRGSRASRTSKMTSDVSMTFTTSVTSFPLPPKFYMPQVKAYDRSKDPLDHLETFKTLMHLQEVADEIMCKAFSITLKGPTRVWFSRLTPNSISTFKELNAQFTSHFIGRHRYKKSTACLMNIKQ